MRLRTLSIALFSVIAILTEHAIPRTFPGEYPLAKPTWARLPIRFEPNVGQASSQTRFLARGAGYTVLLSGHDSTYIFQHGAKAVWMRMELLGARETSSMTPAGLQNSVSNYFLG